MSFLRGKAIPASAVSVDYEVVPINSIQVIQPPREENEDPALTGPTGLSFRADLSKQLKNVRVLIKDEPIAPTERWWQSFAANFGLGTTVFAYFDYAEVFSRIAQRGTENIRVAIERSPGDKPRLLSLTQPHKSFLRYDHALELVNRFRPEDSDLPALGYQNGILTSTHLPRSGDRSYQIGPDDFMNRFVLSVPIDGYGLPEVYLQLLRLVCSNGATGYAPAFRTPIQHGNNIALQLTRVLDGFDHADGFSAFRSRLEASQRTQASVREAVSLFRTLEKCQFDLPVFEKFDRVSGDIATTYGINPSAMAERKARVLPCKSTVYDLINFATELGTHHSTPHVSRVLGAWVGELVSGSVGKDNRPKEYDLEEVESIFEGEFAARFFADDNSAEAAFPAN